MTCISLFSGAGVSDVGFEQAGFKCLAQVEIDQAANRVRRRHFPEVEHFGDIRTFDASRFRGVDAIFGGFPCQDYSVAGRRAGLRGDRGALWWSVHDIARELRPRVLGLENVPGLLSSTRGLSFGTIIASLVELGYRVGWRVLDLQHFGVPQRRRRVHIVGCLGGSRLSPAEILFEPESLRGDFAPLQEAGEEDSQAIAGSLGGGSGTRGYTNSLDVCGAFIPVAHTLRAEGFDASEDGTGRGTPLVPVAYCLRGGTRGASDPDRDTYIPVAFQSWASATQSMNPSRMAPALDVGKAGGVSVLTENLRVRRLTPRECERLMGLPDDYTRWADDGKELADGPRYRMLGNGWSVPQARWLAERILAVSA